MSIRASVLLLAVPFMLGADRADVPANDPDAAQLPVESNLLLQSKNCHDRINQVREQRGLPRLERGTAEDEKPVMIWAVDRRESGCAVMVVKGSPEDVRPLPEKYEGPLFRLIDENTPEGSTVMQN